MWDRDPHRDQTDRPGGLINMGIRRLYIIRRGHDDDCYSIGGRHFFESKQHAERVASEENEKRSGLPWLVYFDDNAWYMNPKTIKPE